MEHVELTTLLQIATDKEDVALFHRIESDLFNGEIIKESYEVVGFKDGKSFGFFDLDKGKAVTKYDVLSCEILTKYNEKRLATYANMQ
ncbi:hypothetical protein [Escherichia phage vB_EcoM-LTH02]|jgi:hypothetical protein